MKQLSAFLSNSERVTLRNCWTFPDAISQLLEPPFLQRNLTQPVAQRDIAAQRFLELLIELRAVILQDVAVLQSLEKYLGHPIIYHSVFEGEEWDKFAAEVLEACNAAEAPPQLVNLPTEVSARAHPLCSNNFLARLLMHT